MKGALTLSDRAIIASYDFCSFKQIIDIATGGQGDGELIASILKQNKAATGVHFDSSTRLERAKTALDSADIGDRAQLIAGDFFKSVPEGGDAYIVKNLIHDYNDAQACKILHNLRQAIADQGKLLIVEMLVPPGNEASLAKILDVEALIMTPGAIERTAEQYSQLLARSGFKVSRIIPTKSPMSIVEAILN